MQQDEKEVEKDDEGIVPAESDKEVQSTPLVKVEVETVEAIEEDTPEEQMVSMMSSSPTISDDSFSTTSLQTSEQFAIIKATSQAIGDMKAIASVLIKGQLCPLKKEEDVVLAIITGNQYGFPFMTSVNNIFPINGKPTMSVHLHRALLLKHKIVFNKIADFEPMYDFAATDAEGKVLTRKVSTPQGEKQVPIILKRDIMANKPANSIASNPVDTVTRYEFSRLLRQIDGTFAKISVVSEYKLSDASTADLLSKDNWVKHTPRMLDARAFAIGSKEIASDILLGVYTISELADEFNVKYTVSASLEETVIN